MSGASPRHNRISGRPYRAVAAHLEAGPCEACVVDVQVKPSINQDQNVYYPDVMVTCAREHPGEGFMSKPELIVDVLSPSTAGVARFEKRFIYQWLQSLVERATFAQDSAEVDLYPMEHDWRHVIHVALEEPIESRSIELALPLA